MGPTYSYGPMQYASEIIYLACSPTPEITGNAGTCLGSTDNLCVNYVPSSTCAIDWAPALQIGNGAHGQCFNTLVSLPAGNPTVQNQTVSVTVSTGGCSATASEVISSYPNNPAFSLTLNPVCPTNYCTASALPVI